MTEIVCIVYSKLYDVYKTCIESFIVRATLLILRILPFIQTSVIQTFQQRKKIIIEKIRELAPRFFLRRLTPIKHQYLNFYLLIQFELELTIKCSTVNTKIIKPFIMYYYTYYKLREYSDRERVQKPGYCYKHRLS